MTQTWRVSSAGRAFAIVVLVLAGIGASATVVSRLDPALKIAITVPIGVYAALAYITALRPSITLADSELVIRNRFSTHRIDLHTIARVHAGYQGIQVQTKHGQVIHGWAVQKSNLARWLGRQTRADLVVEAIEKEAQARVERGDGLSAAT